MQKCIWWLRKHAAGEHKVRLYEAKTGVNNASFSVGANLVFARLALRSPNTPFPHSPNSSIPNPIIPLLSTILYKSNKLIIFLFDTN